jgi:hypothetical protein
LAWVGKRVRNAKVIAESMSRNSPIAPGRAAARWARSWFAIDTRAATKSWRARTFIRSATVAALSGTSGLSRCRSVRTVSASTYASQWSSLFPAAP